MNLVADRLKYFDSGDFNKAFVKHAQIFDPIDLSIGEPEDKLSKKIKQAGIDAFLKDKTTYTPVNGILELRTKIALKLINENNIKATPEDVTIVPGLTSGQLLVYLAILNPGEEVIIFEPFYPPYLSLLSIAQAVPKIISTFPEFNIDLLAIEQAITPKTKAIVINSPNNPSGMMYSEVKLRKLAKLAAKYNLLVIADEIYEYYSYNIKHFSIGSIYPNTITLNGFSKSFSMTGLRLGYIHADQKIIDAINAIQQYAVFSSNSIAQHCALAALDNQPNLRIKYIAKRDLLVKGLKDLGYEVYEPKGGYYLFIKVPLDMDDLSFVELAAKHQIILVPGRSFSSNHHYVRISYGTDIHTIKRSLPSFNRLINY